MHRRCSSRRLGGVPSAGSPAWRPPLQAVAVGLIEVGLAQHRIIAVRPVLSDERRYAARHLAPKSRRSRRGTSWPWQSRLKTTTFRREVLDELDGAATASGTQLSDTVPDWRRSRRLLGGRPTPPAFLAASGPSRLRLADPGEQGKMPDAWTTPCGCPAEGDRLARRLFVGVPCRRRRHGPWAHEIGPWAEYVQAPKGDVARKTDLRRTPCTAQHILPPHPA